mgnify:CR=1 FL=1
MNSGVIKEGRSRRRRCSKGEDGRSRVSVNCARRWVSANENKGGSDRREGGGRKNKISCCLKLQAAQPRDANVDCSFPTLWPIRAPPNSLPWRPSHTCAIAINNQHRDCQNIKTFFTLSHSNHWSRPCFTHTLFVLDALS